MHKKDLLARLFLLISLLLLIDMAVLDPSIFNEFGIDLTLFLIFLMILGVLSVVISVRESNARRFFFIFWNPIVAGFVGSLAFFLLQKLQHLGWLLKASFLLIIGYACFVIYYTHVFANSFALASEMPAEVQAKLHDKEP